MVCTSDDSPWGRWRQRRAQSKHGRRTDATRQVAQHFTERCAGREWWVAILRCSTEASTTSARSGVRRCSRTSMFAERSIAAARSDGGPTIEPGSWPPRSTTPGPTSPAPTISSPPLRPPASKPSASPPTTSGEPKGRNARTGTGTGASEFRSRFPESGSEVGSARRRFAAPGPTQPRAARAAMSCGSTLWTSPTMPRSATPKIGASLSLLIAMMFFEPFMPTLC